MLAAHVKKAAVRSINMKKYRMLFVGPTFLILANVLLTASANAETLIQVQHVRLVGEFMPAGMKEQLEDSAKLCAEMGKTLQKPPPGDKLFESIDDAYFAPGATTIYKQIKVYMLTADCKMKRDDKLEILSITSLGVCRSTPWNMRSVGYCDVDISSISRLPDKKFGRNSAVLNGESTVILGYPCTFLNIDLMASSRSCVIRTGAFSNVTNMYDFKIGVELKRDFSIGDGAGKNFHSSEATEIHTNIMVPLFTLFPQLSGKYKVFSSQLPNRD
ncbi:hypothetical protein GCM10022212_29750 [Actimicrobium antarcticum]|uniref:Uncharacterized protein n=2 Tax=Actimicrobium antarcticum TaxID=1051899 RepID=A0ABP7TQ77_9BURK